jgi:hypothetical protein
MVLSRSGRILTLISVLFFVLSWPAFPQCEQHYSLERSFTVEGINNGTDHYYQNLIIQDLAISGQLKFQEISLRFDYLLLYSVDQCPDSQVDINVKPVKVSCSPHFYQGYNISSSIKPETADLIFNLKNENGIIFDSIIFYRIKVRENSELYTLQTYKKIKPAPVQADFSRAVFHYSKDSYEKFRDHILEIDNYYAASAMADSLAAWTAHGLLAENDTTAVMFLRQQELERTLHFMDPKKFNMLTSGGRNDLLGLQSKYKVLSGLNNRYRAIILYHHTSRRPGIKYFRNQIFREYLDHFDFYYQLSFRTDFRYTNFLNSLSCPAYTNAGLSGLYGDLCRVFGSSGIRKSYLSKILVNALLDRGNRFELESNQLRALVYYRSALHASELLHVSTVRNTANLAAIRMIGEIASSYIEISNTSAERDNPKIAAQYFNDARLMFSDTTLRLDEPNWLLDYEHRLFAYFEEQAYKYLSQGNYLKTMAYLNEIQDHSISNPDYPIPARFHDWMQQAREGIYIQLLNKAANLLKADEQPESELVYQQALEMRSQGGYHIDKNVAEAKLEVVFRQSHYDEYYEEGLRHYQKNEYVSALYYFNKADYIEKTGRLGRPKPVLEQYRQESARQIILSLLSDGRVKAWAHDFDGAESVIRQVSLMLPEYGFSKTDTVVVAYNDLQKNILRTECDHISSEYNILMTTVEEAERKADYIKAFKLACDAVNMSMGSLKCGINDEYAWYQKIRLESLAGYQEMENDLDLLINKPTKEYLAAFQELKTFYYRNKLLEQGVMFTPLFDRIIARSDSAFLCGMLDHYMYLKDFERSLEIMGRMKELKFNAKPLKDRQKKLAAYMAQRDAVNVTEIKPWEKLGGYTDHNKWYHSFNWSYKLSWLKTTGWKLKYWPLIWRK